MRVEKNGKTLYHVQSITDWHDDAYDMFVWANSERDITDKLEQLYKDDCEDIDETELLDLIENSNVYTVYAEEV